ncbi:guanine deaminase [Iodidimonas muriae]|uniref:Guanine deaminase n=1 Tax=Iodidimonas muriae TaxID=261467 RepID=A0ABQ2LG59_9PROT|nr:guanine deaminase [Iodidimonas muriae]GER08743.1 guanine deaminase [Kordiimonadales bacterium JCM 17843]GGO16476.1 guanine deaminase [Iodidimonas muriae]
MNASAHRGEIFTLTDDPAKGAGAAVYHADGVLVIEDGLITACGAWDSLGPTLSPDMPVTHHKNGVMVPGFVDAHVHFPQLSMIASPGKQLMDWLKSYTFPAEESFADPEYCKAAAPVFLDALLAHGTTSALVFASVHEQSVEALFEAAYARNMRLVAGKVLMDRDAPDALLEPAEEGYQKSKALIERWHGKGRLGYAVTPRFAPTCSKESLQSAGRLLAEYPDILLQTHLSENHAEIARVAELFPEADDYLDVYEQSGMVGDRSVFAHCVHLDEGALSRLAKARSSIAFCPSSNLFLGSGLMDYEAARKAGIEIGLGSDVGAGTSLSLLATMSEAYKVAHIKGTVIAAEQAFYHATLGGARALHMADRVGSLKPGMEADFLVLDYAATPVIAGRMAVARDFMERLFVLMMLGDDRAVRHVYLAGKPVAGHAFAATQQAAP